MHSLNGRGDLPYEWNMSDIGGRGPAKGYAEALQLRLRETENALFRICQLPQFNDIDKWFEGDVNPVSRQEGFPSSQQWLETIPSFAPNASEASYIPLDSTSLDSSKLGSAPERTKLTEYWAPVPAKNGKRSFSLEG